MEETMKNKNQLIGCCGLDCETYDARIAMITNDNTLREKTAARWTKLNGVTITPDMTNCTGCRIDGAKAARHPDPADWAQKGKIHSHGRSANEHCDAGCAHRTASLHRFRLEPSSHGRETYRLLCRIVMSIMMIKKIRTEPLASLSIISLVGFGIWLLSLTISQKTLLKMVTGTAWEFQYIFFMFICCMVAIWVWLSLWGVKKYSNKKKRDKIKFVICVCLEYVIIVGV